MNVDFVSARLGQTDDTHTEGIGVPIYLDGNCSDIHISRSVKFGSAPIKYDCARSEITVGDVIRPITSYHVPVTVRVANKPFVVAIPDTFDQAQTLIKNIGPKGYVVQVRATKLGTEPDGRQMVRIANARRGLDTCLTLDLASISVGMTTNATYTAYNKGDDDKGCFIYAQYDGSDPAYVNIELYVMALLM